MNDAILKRLADKCKAATANNIQIMKNQKEINKLRAKLARNNA